MRDERENSAGLTKGNAESDAKNKEEKRDQDAKGDSEKEGKTDDDSLNQIMSFARVTEVALPDTFRQQNIRATEEATRSYFQQRKEEREKLASDPLASFGRVPITESAYKRQRESSQATDSIVYERFLKHSRWGNP